MNILERQTFVISVNLANFSEGPPEIPSIISLPMNLRFAANGMILKTIVYNNTGIAKDDDNVIQIWCNITNDNLIGAFPNSSLPQFPVVMHLDNYFSISNTFQTGNFTLQFQNTRFGNPASYNPQSLISSTTKNTHGTVVLTIEFVRQEKIK